MSILEKVFELPSFYSRVICAGVAKLVVFYRIVYGMCFPSTSTASEGKSWHILTLFISQNSKMETWISHVRIWMHPSKPELRCLQSRFTHTNLILADGRIIPRHCRSLPPFTPTHLHRHLSQKCILKSSHHDIALILSQKRRERIITGIHSFGGWQGLDRSKSWERINRDKERTVYIFDAPIHLATVRLGFSDSVYRISHISCFSSFMHGCKFHKLIYCPSTYTRSPRSLYKLLW